MTQCGRPTDWQCDVSAMLSQIGCVTLPAETLEKIYEGAQLNDDEVAMAAKLPSLAERLVAHIPRLEGVRENLLHMGDLFEPPKPGQLLRGEAIPWGSRALKVILDYLVLDSRTGSPSTSLDTMRGRLGHYDPTILQAFSTLLGNATATVEVRQLSIKELRIGMVLRENVVTRTGMLLMAKDHEVTTGLLERIANFSRSVGVREPIEVIVGRGK
jgi:hypothetical protein